jgi:hypothetical protein
MPGYRVSPVENIPDFTRVKKKIAAKYLPDDSGCPN